MAINLFAKLDGITGALQINGVDALTYTATGLTSGSNSIGQGQTHSSPTRVLGTTYVNSGTKPIVCYVGVTNGGGAANLTVTVDGFALPTVTIAAAAAGSGVTYTFIVPAGKTYVCSSSSGALTGWVELA